jgi:hypothetical protein
MAWAGDVAGWEWPYTGGFQITVEWRGTWHTLKRWRAGSSHTLEAPKAVWFGGGVAWLHLFLEAAVELLISGSRAVTPLVFLGAHSFTRYRTSYPTLPLFPVFRKLIPPSDIFEVKI